MGRFIITFDLIKNSNYTLAGNLLSGMGFSDVAPGKGGGSVRFPNTTRVGNWHGGDAEKLRLEIQRTFAANGLQVTRIAVGHLVQDQMSSFSSSGALGFSALSDD
jgi:hypothetical protein